MCHLEFFRGNLSPNNRKGQFMNFASQRVGEGLPWRYTMRHGVSKKGVPTRGGHKFSKISVRNSWTPRTWRWCKRRQIRRWSSARELPRWKRFQKHYRSCKHYQILFACQKHYRSCKKIKFYLHAQAKRLNTIFWLFDRLLGAFIIYKTIFWENTIRHINQIQSYGIIPCWHSLSIHQLTDYSVNIEGSVIFTAGQSHHILNHLYKCT